ncbi:MAG: restriction endonuclease subunit S [Pelagimonas sp.]
MSKFAGFQDVPVITLDELTQIGDIELGRGNIISKIDIRENSGSYPIYSSSSKNNGMMGRYGKFMFDEEMVTWSVDGGGKFFYRPRHKFSVTNVSGYMRANQEKFAYKFLHDVLDFQHSFLNFDYQSKAHPSVIRELYEVPIPPLPEQKKIASILTSVDDVIESTQKQIDKLQDLKKATMNELLTKGIGHTEFKDSELGRIPKSWEVLEIGNLLDRTKKYPMRSGPFGSALLKDELVARGVPFLGIDNVQVEHFVGAFKRYITEQKFSELSKYQVFADDLIVTIMGTVGRCCIIPKNITTAISSKHTWVITFDAKKIISHLVCWQVNHAEWVLRHFADNSQGGVMSSISSETLRTTIVPVPPMEEQLKIFNVYMEFQKLISEASKKLIHLQSLKKSLMQDLLTGKVRVKVD